MYRTNIEAKHCRLPWIFVIIFEVWHDMPIFKFFSKRLVIKLWPVEDSWLKNLDSVHDRMGINYRQCKFLNVLWLKPIYHNTFPSWVSCLQRSLDEAKVTSSVHFSLIMTCYGLRLLIFQGLPSLRFWAPSQYCRWRWCWPSLWAKCPPSFAPSSYMEACWFLSSLEVKTAKLSIICYMGQNPS